MQFNEHYRDLRDTAFGEWSRVAAGAPRLNCSSLEKLSCQNRWWLATFYQSVFTLAGLGIVHSPLMISGSGR